MTTIAIADLIEETERRHRNGQAQIITLDDIAPAPEMSPGNEQLARVVKKAQETAARATDYVVDARAIAMTEDGHIGTDFASEALIPQRAAHSQIASILEIPGKYYERMRAEAPRLLADNVNRWMPQQRARMLRTLDIESDKPQLRAMLSSQYRIVDNMDVLGEAIPELDRAALQISRADITPDRMTITAHLPRDHKHGFEIKPGSGDIVSAGVTITNSENGSGCVTVEPFFFRWICSNGMIGKVGNRNRAFSARHAGRSLRPGQVTRRVIEAEHRAILANVQSAVRHALDPRAIEDDIAMMRRAAGEDVPEPRKALERLNKANRITETQLDSILARFIRNSQRDGSNRWAFANAVTEEGRDTENADTRHDLETLGAEIVARPALTAAR